MKNNFANSSEIPEEDLPLPDLSDDSFRQMDEEIPSPENEGISSSPQEETLDDLSYLFDKEPISNAVDSNLSDIREGDEQSDTDDFRGPQIDDEALDDEMDGGFTWETDDSQVDSPQTQEEDFDSLLELLDSSDNDEKPGRTSRNFRKEDESKSFNDDEGFSQENKSRFPGEENNDAGENTSEEVEKESEKEKPKKQSPEDSKGNSWKEKFEKFKKQVAAEMKGKDSPEEKDAPFQKEEKEKEDKKNPRTRGDKKSTKKKGSRAYMKLVNENFKVLDKILSLLGAIPIVGKPFAYARKFGKVLKIVATSLPLVLLVLVAVLVNMSTVKGSIEESYPDNGAATFTEFSYDKETQTAKGVLNNDGDVILDVQPVFEIYATTPNPWTWIRPQKIGECKAKDLTLDIDKSTIVTASCKIPEKRHFVKISGKLL